MPRAPLISLFAAAFLLVASPWAGAMGFGKTVASATLGQPLGFSAAVLLEGDESLPRECVAASVFVGDAMLSPRNVRVTLEPARAGTGRVVRVTTTTLIDEPIVAVEVSIGCTSRISRRFVSFVDPPLVYLAHAQGEAREPQQGLEPRTAPSLDAVRSGTGSRRSAPAARRAFASGQAPASPTEARPPRPRPERTAAVIRSPVPLDTNRGARLQLEAPPPIVAAASAPAETAPSLVPPPVTATVTAPAFDVERERMQTLEAGFARLAAESKANQQSIVTLQARLHQAENERYANGLVYALGAGVLFLAVLAALLWALRPGQGRRSRWFDAAASRQARAQRKAGEPVVPTPPAETPEVVVISVAKVSRSGPPTIASPARPTIGGLDVTTVIGADVPGTTPVAEPGLHPSYEPAAVRRGGSMSMEELVDLEQQAEFFVVLGQDEAAIELLAAHLREGEGVSPLPFLTLLEIHRRRDDRLAYERVREAFKERFRAFAPDWNADLQRGRSLEDHAQTVARLQALWPTPMQAMQALDSLLFRRSESGEAFDFPAYRDLLFLYSVARELTGNVDTELGAIDLFLPLDDGAAGPATDVQALDLDVDSLLPDAGEAFVIRRAPGRRSAA